MGGCGCLYNAYIGGRTLQFERPVIRFVLLVFGVVLVFFCYVCNQQYWKAFSEGLTRKSFDYSFINAFPPAKRLFYNVFHSHGKFYLRRLYGVEIIESLYQVFNFRLFSCRMATGWLFLYCLVMGSAASFQLYQVRHTRTPIGNHGKNFENLVDMFLELFCTIFPMVIIYNVHNIYFSDNEVIQIVSVPLFAFMLKVIQVNGDEICLAVDDARIQRDNAVLPPTQRGERRRRSVAQREQALKTLQNEYLGPIWRRGMLFFYALFVCFYVLLTGVQIGNFFIVEPDHFQYCKINVPSCSYWVYPKNNCLQIAHLRTTGQSSDAILAKFTGSDAAVAVKVSDLQDLQLLNQFPKLRTVVLYKSNVTHIDIDWNFFPELIVVNMGGFRYAKKAHRSFYKNNLHRITYSEMPELELEAFDVPNALQLELIRVGRTVPEINGPEITVLQLVDYGIDRLPDGLKDVPLFTILKISGNNFTQMNTPTSFVVDLRNNRIREFPKTLAKHNYGYGNPAPCPDGWKCDEDLFCHPKCTNAYHEIKTEKACTLDCVLWCGPGKCKDFIE
jgi:hypothetical protein